MHPRPPLTSLEIRCAGIPQSARPGAATHDVRLRAASQTGEKAWRAIVKKSDFVIGHGVRCEWRRDHTRRNRTSWCVSMPTTAISEPWFRMRQNLDCAPVQSALGCALVFAAHVQERESPMTKAGAARQQRFTPEEDETRCELARGLPPPMDWRSEARRALAPVRLGVDGSGRIIRAEGTPTSLVLDPLLSGRQVYIRDECGTKYWLGSPNSLRAVIRWLLS